MKAQDERTLPRSSGGHEPARARPGALAVAYPGGATATTTSNASSDLPRVMTDEEAGAVFDGAARDNLGISGDEFVRQWDAGEYRDPDAADVRNVVMYLGLVRPRA